MIQVHYSLCLCSCWQHVLASECRSHALKKTSNDRIGAAVCCHSQTRLILEPNFDIAQN